MSSLLTTGAVFVVIIVVVANFVKIILYPYNS